MPRTTPQVMASSPAVTAVEFPRITNVNFFHAARAYDWRLNSSRDALEACRTALAR